MPRVWKEHTRSTLYLFLFGQRRHLATWLLEAKEDVRANAWARLVTALGATEASRRWRAAFASSDAAET